MPRKFYQPKNRYCRNANISEEMFSVILWYYLQVAPATKAREAIDRDARFQEKSPSVKTISSYYTKLGEYLFQNTFALMLNEVDDRLNGIKESHQDSYYRIVEEVGENWADYLLGQLTYENFSLLTEEDKITEFYNDYIVEFRKISAARKGLRGDRRGDMALAYWRSFFSIRYTDQPKLGYAEDYEKTVHIYLNTQKWLEDNPL